VKSLPFRPTRGGARLASVLAGALALATLVPSPAQAQSGHVTANAPAPLASFISPGRIVWRGVGRPVQGQHAVYVTSMRMPDGPYVAGIAWMNTHLLSARLYSGSLSPGGVGWHYSAPVTPGAARTLVAAFNGGFLMKDSFGGYLSEGRLVAPLRRGAASLVIYRNGDATVGMWGRDVNRTANVVAVRQNLRLLVDNGRVVTGLHANDVSAWGMSLNNVVNDWRSGLGVTASGDLVYVSGPINIVDLANTLVRAGAVRAMVLDMNPLWPVFATYSPSSPTGLAAPGNGTTLLANMIQTPARFFQPTYSRDFITMSAR
jgi:Phosphodiester glycosidase